MAAYIIARVNVTDWDQYREYMKVTPEDVQRVAKEYLSENRLVMSFVPGKSQGAPSRGSAANRPTSVSGRQCRRAFR